MQASVLFSDEMHWHVILSKKREKLSQGETDLIKTS